MAKKTAPSPKQPAPLPSTPLAGAALIGVNDDAAKDPAQVGWFYPALAAEGLTESTPE